MCCQFSGASLNVLYTHVTQVGCVLKYWVSVEFFLQVVLVAWVILKKLFAVTHTHNFQGG